MIDFSKIKTYSIKERKNKVKISDFRKLKVLDNLPDCLKSKEFRNLIKKIVESKQTIVMIGGHVVKTGQSLNLIELMKKGVIKHIAMNGATAIHDFEIALIGETSEDVKENIKNGKFGMVEETGRMMNEAIKDNFGKDIGKLIYNLKYKEYSILYWAYKLGIPASVHVAIGTDIIHQHPSCNGEKIGRASYNDFKLFTESISKLENGVLLNFGSAVIMPEVFLKALTIVRNLGFKVENFVAANFDMLDMYRPRMNIVERPGKNGFYFICRHEESIPLLTREILKLIK